MAELAGGLFALIILAAYVAWLAVLPSIGLLYVFGVI